MRKPKHLAPSNPPANVLLTDLEADLITALRNWQKTPHPDTRKAVHIAYYRAAPLIVAPLSRIHRSGRHAHQTI